MRLSLSGSLLLRCGLGLHHHLLEVGLEFLDRVGLVRHLSLEFVLKGLKSGNLLVDKCYSLLDIVFDFHKTLLGENWTHHFEDVRVILKHFKL